MSVQCLKKTMLPSSFLQPNIAYSAPNIASWKRGAYLVQILQHLDGNRPIYASIRNTYTVLQRLWSFIWHILSSRVDVTLYHHTGNIPISSYQLIADGRKNFVLIIMILL